MKPKRSKIKIKDLKVLGSYAKMYHDAEMYPHSLRKLSKDVKKNDITAISVAALLLSHIIAPNALIIPIPQSSGVAEYTLEIANTIRIIRHDCQVADVLVGTPRKKLYELKKSKVELEKVDMGLKVKDGTDLTNMLEQNSNVFLLDNVINTGFTYECARKALKEYMTEEPSLLAISATSNWLNNKCKRI